jgi:dihydropteroate synthase
VIDRPIIMGILNATPDSFYTKGNNFSIAGMVKQAEKMIQEGANILDIGGMSTRPGSDDISTKEEINRVIPILKAIRTHFPDIFLSIDTYRSEVVRAAATEGVDIINDISSGSMDASMIQTVADTKLPYIAMHMQGTPKNMQIAPQYDDICYDVLNYCASKITTCRAMGIKDIIIDPGFGFGKTITQNYSLLKGLHTFNILDVPLLVGVSRKSMIYKYLETSPEDALNGTTIVNNWALDQGAHILRVHDVKAANELIKLRELYNHS